MSYVPRPVTQSIEELPSWLTQETTTIAQVLAAFEPNLLYIREVARPPAKPRNGQLVYADGTLWDPGGGRGLYYYKGDAWKRLRDAQPAAAFFGAPGNMTITTTKNDVANWPNSASGGGEWVIDPVTGTMTIPEDGVYSLVFWIYGNQGNDIKEESMRLGVRVDTTDYYLDVFAVATDKTDERAFSGTLTRRFIAEENVTLFMDATAGLGTFAFSGGTFELVKLFD